MVTRNDDPPDDPPHDPRIDLIHTELEILDIGSFASMIDMVTSYVITKIDRAYADGYVDGKTAADEAAEEANDDKVDGRPG